MHIGIVGTLGPHVRELQGIAIIGDLLHGQIPLRANYHVASGRRDVTSCRGWDVEHYLPIR